jgi:protein-L-isoaspartate O-methyltransferase
MSTFLLIHTANSIQTLKVVEEFDREWKTRKQGRRNSNMRVLEVGCGQGNDMALLNQFNHSSLCLELAPSAVNKVAAKAKLMRAPQPKVIYGDLCAYKAHASLHC